MRRDRVGRYGRVAARAGSAGVDETDGEMRPFMFGLATSSALFCLIPQTSPSAMMDLAFAIIAGLMVGFGTALK